MAPGSPEPPTRLAIDSPGDCRRGDARQAQQRRKLMPLEITLTGQLAAEADGNRADATDLPGRQASGGFPYLVAERGRPVPAEELAEAVWGAALPPTWRPALRGVVSKVRDFLELLGLPAADALTRSSGCPPL